ncbi:MAG: hypothetical protein ACKVP5_06410 [Aestuariivirga sp.]
MDVENEIHSLSGDTLALQTIIAELCLGLVSTNPHLRDTISKVFDNAANHCEDIAIRFGKSASPEHTVKALRVVEEIRTLVLGKQQKPSG